MVHGRSAGGSSKSGIVLKDVKVSFHQCELTLEGGRSRELEVVVHVSLVHGRGGSSKSGTAEGEGFDGSNLRVQLRALVDIPEGDEFRM